MTERHKGYVALALLLATLVLIGAYLAHQQHPSPSRQPVHPTTPGDIA